MVYNEETTLNDREEDKNNYNKEIITDNIED